MRFEGKLAVQSEIDKVWSFISDPRKVIQCIPGIEEYSVDEEKRVTARVKVSIGFIKGVFHASSRVLEEDPQAYVAKLNLTGSGAGSGFNGVVEIRLRSLNGSTEIAWWADVNVSGPLGSLAKPMLEGYVRRIIEQLFDCVKQRLA
ncbi:MAG: carbon monoxide dehydrogenase subunit G [Thaumarchaeota archaeon]|jgi:carbon monoxide dehydrogenase subunit G|nr:carbon monoxide dehydrogenase subunit G [Candidatus Geocrenenecus arthurdayi]MCL7397174.1 carbon monoxide dehydrogenase subunit G [Candidatus Geocrenenecus arthurdayi]